MRSEELDKELQLIRLVFNSSAGKELLELWKSYHVMSPVMDENALVMAYRAGKLEFVTTIYNCLEGG